MIINIFFILLVSIFIWIYKYLLSNYLIVKWNFDFLKFGFFVFFSVYNLNYKLFLLELFYCNFIFIKYICMYF